MDKDEVIERNLAIMNSRHKEKLMNLTEPAVATGYKRTRNGKQVLELPLDSTSLITGNKALSVYYKREDGCQLKVFLLDDILSVIVTDNCYIYGGVGVTFDDDFVRKVKAIKISLTESGIRFSFTSICEEEDLDGLGAKVYMGWLPGLAKCYDSIVMAVPGGHHRDGLR